MTGALTSYIGPIFALVFTIALVVWLRPFAKAVGLVDIPNERKVHKGEIPLIGGISIYVAVVASAIVIGLLNVDAQRSLEIDAFLLGGLALVLVGVIDDYRDMSPFAKLLVQAVAALIMIFGARVYLQDLGYLGVDGEELSLGMLAVPFTVFCTIGVINAINMSDGLDGLAGSLSLVSLGGFIAASAIFGNGQDLGILLVLAAATAGFLIFNYRLPGRNSAVVFLGDSGSMFLGFALCWFAIKFSQGPDRIMSPSAALWFLILPVFDAVSMTTRRILKKRPPFGADREHLHHVFLLAGFTVSETVAIMSGIAVLGVSAGLLATYIGVPDIWILSAYLLCGALYLWMIVRSWSVMRFLRYSICRRHNMEDRRVIPDRRVSNNQVVYLGPERRSGIDRRTNTRRSQDMTSGAEDSDLLRAG